MKPKSAKFRHSGVFDRSGIKWMLGFMLFDDVYDNHEGCVPLRSMFWRCSTFSDILHLNRPLRELKSDSYICFHMLESSLQLARAAKPNYVYSLAQPLTHARTIIV